MADTSDELLTSTEDGSESLVLSEEDLIRGRQYDDSFEEESEEDLPPITAANGLVRRAWEDQMMFIKRVNYTTRILEVYPKLDDGSYDGTTKEDLEYFCEQRFHKAKTNQKYDDDVEEFIKVLDSYYTSTD